jgi:hypothetical protein
MQQFGPPAQEGHHLGPQIARTHRPARPVIEIGFEGQMDEAIGQCTGHARRDSAVAFAIAGGEHGPAVRQAIFAQGTIKHQLVAGSLHQRWRGIQFVEEQDPGAVLRQERRDRPGRPALLDCGQPTQIDWVEQDRPDIDQAYAQ